ncbi:MAG: chorismate mutase [Actinomycetia bacterium]|nr:chorismate mutase [Actinomycetes bacterium]
MNTERIETLRAEIDEINTELLGLISRRLELSVQIGALKQESRLPLYSEDRERDLIDRFRMAAEALDIDPDYAAELMTVVLVHSRAAQHKTNSAAIEEMDDGVSGSA